MSWERRFAAVVSDKKEKSYYFAVAIKLNIF